MEGSPGDQRGAARPWMRIQTGHATKGAREYDWAWLDVRADDTPSGHGDDGTSALVAHGRGYTGEHSFFRCWNPWTRSSLFSRIAAAVLTLTATATVDPLSDRSGSSRWPVLNSSGFSWRSSSRPPVREAEHVLHGMGWRRHRQAVARACHQRRHELQEQPSSELQLPCQTSTQPGYLPPQPQDR